MPYVTLPPCRHISEDSRMAPACRMLLPVRHYTTHPAVLRTSTACSLQYTWSADWHGTRRAGRGDSLERCRRTDAGSSTGTGIRQRCPSTHDERWQHDASANCTQTTAADRARWAQTRTAGRSWCRRSGSATGRVWNRRRAATEPPTSCPNHTLRSLHKQTQSTNVWDYAYSSCSFLSTADNYLAWSNNLQQSSYNFSKTFTKKLWREHATPTMAAPTGDDRK